jgi:hypothetical protein
LLPLCIFELHGDGFSEVPKQQQEENNIYTVLSDDLYIVTVNKMMNRKNSFCVCCDGLKLKLNIHNL